MLAGLSPLSRSANCLLGALEPEALKSLLPDLDRVTAARGEVLHKAGEPVRSIYFPETAIVALAQHDFQGRSIETGLIGREGFIGWSAVMGGLDSVGQAVVQLNGGTLLRIEAERMEILCDRHPVLRQSLLLFVDSYLSQMSCSMLVSTAYPLASRLARWLLMRHDRLSTDELHVQHDEISASLGVRRASITDCLHILEGDRLVRSRRGKIMIISRSGLEVLAGEIYRSADHKRRDHEALANTSEIGRTGSRNTNQQARMLEQHVML